MNRRRSLSLVAAAVVVCAPQPFLLARQQPPTFRSSTTLVEVDVIVQETNGRFRGRLRPEDFTVYEDGRLQRVEQAYLVTGGVARRLVGTTDERVQETDLTLPDVRRTFVLYFDNAHLSLGAWRRARAAAEQFLTTDFRTGDACGIVFDRRIARNRLSRSRTELLAMLAALPVDPSSVVSDGREGEPQRTDAGTGAASSGTGGTPSRAGSGSDPKATGFEFGERSGPRRVLDSLARLADGLGGYPGRKTIIFFSDGFVVPGLVPGSGQLGGGAWDAVRRVIAAAARASVRIYALDTRGLDHGSASGSILNAEKPVESDLAQGVPSGPTATDTLTTLSSDTGGRCIRNENDFPKAVHEIASEVSSYYVLGYRPTNTDADGRFREIKVRVNRAGSVVRARKGYVAGAPPSRQESTPPLGTSSSADAATASERQLR